MNKQLKWVSLISGFSIICMAMLLLIVLAVAVAKFHVRYEKNAFTGRKQLIALTTEEQVAYSNDIIDSWEIEEETVSTERVNRIGQKLIKNNDLAKSGFEFKFFVIRDTNAMLNAFSQIGGNIYITRSLLDSCKTNDEVAFILSHELVHTVGQHVVERWTKSVLLEQTFNLFKGESVTSLLGSKMVDLTKLKFTRLNEEESDFYGVQLMIKSGFDPTAALDSFDFLESQFGEGSTFFSDHPNISYRRNTIKRAIERFESEKK